MEASAWILPENVGNEQPVAVLPSHRYNSRPHVIIDFFIHVQVPPNARIQPNDACARHPSGYIPSLFRVIHPHRHYCRSVSVFPSFTILVYFIPGIYSPPKRVAAFFIPFPVFQKLKRADEQQETRRVMEARLQNRSTFETMRFGQCTIVSGSDVAGRNSPSQGNPRDVRKPTSHFTGTGRIR